MSQKKQNFSINQFETYSAPELSFENININTGEKKKSINVRSKSLIAVPSYKKNNYQNNYKFSYKS